MTEPADVGRLFRVTYLASHPDFSKSVEGLQLVFTTDGMWLIEGKEGLVFVPWEEIRDIAADEREVLERRVTATRVLMMGAVAWIAKKKRVLSYLVVTDISGEWIFAVPDFGAMELRAWIQPLRTYITNEPEPAAPADPSIRDRLENLDALLRDGIVSADEHARRRAALIDLV